MQTAIRYAARGRPLSRAAARGFVREKNTSMEVSPSGVAIIKLDGDGASLAFTAREVQSLSRMLPGMRDASIGRQERS